MIKDGRSYLVLCSWKSDALPNWEIVKWGAPIGLSDPSGREGWVTQNGFALRMDNCTFEESYELDVVVDLLRGVRSEKPKLGESRILSVPKTLLALDMIRNSVPVTLKVVKPVIQEPRVLGEVSDGIHPVRTSEYVRRVPVRLTGMQPAELSVDVGAKFKIVNMLDVDRVIFCVPDDGGAIELVDEDHIVMDGVRRRFSRLAYNSSRQYVFSLDPLVVVPDGSDLQPIQPDDDFCTYCGNFEGPGGCDGDCES